MPPLPEEASRNLTAPEIAPAHTHLDKVTPIQETLHAQVGLERIDGRTLRKTGRTVQFATRVSLDFDDRLRRIAQREGIKLVEVLEHALDVYELSKK